MTMISAVRDHRETKDKRNLFSSLKLYLHFIHIFLSFNDSGIIFRLVTSSYSYLYVLA